MHARCSRRRCDAVLRVGWQAGDTLAVTSTAPLINCTLARNDACEVEEVTLLGISGNVVTLTAPLRYNHTVETLEVAGRFVSLRTEVINLNRNVRLVGSVGPGSAGFGGHVMLLFPVLQLHVPACVAALSL